MYTYYGVWIVTWYGHFQAVLTQSLSLYFVISFFRFLVREFVYDEQALEAGKNEITKLESDKKKQFVSSLSSSDPVLWCICEFSDCVVKCTVCTVVISLKLSNNQNDIRKLFGQFWTIYPTLGTVYDVRALFISLQC